MIVSECMDKEHYKTLVIGASTNPDRYSSKVLQLLQHQGYAVIALGNNPGTIHGVTIQTEKLLYKDIHTVTLYINPEVQNSYKDYILKLKPERIIFNPGTENASFEAEAKNLGIVTENACTLVLLTTGGYENIQ